MNVFLSLSIYLTHSLLWPVLKNFLNYTKKFACELNINWVISYSRCAGKTHLQLALRVRVFYLSYGFAGIHIFYDILLYGILALKVVDITLRSINKLFYFSTSFLKNSN